MNWRNYGSCLCMKGQLLFFMVGRPTDPWYTMLVHQIGPNLADSSDLLQVWKFVYTGISHGYRFLLLYRRYYHQPHHLLNIHLVSHPSIFYWQCNICDIKWRYRRVSRQRRGTNIQYNLSIKTTLKKHDKWFIKTDGLYIHGLFHRFPELVKPVLKTTCNE